MVTSLDPRLRLAIPSPGTSPQPHLGDEVKCVQKQLRLITVCVIANSLWSNHCIDVQTCGKIGQTAGKLPFSILLLIRKRFHIMLGLDKPPLDDL